MHQTKVVHARYQNAGWRGMRIRKRRGQLTGLGQPMCDLDVFGSASSLAFVHAPRELTSDSAFAVAEQCQRSATSRSLVEHHVPSSGLPDPCLTPKMKIAIKCQLLSDSRRNFLRKILQTRSWVSGYNYENVNSLLMHAHRPKVPGYPGRHSRIVTPRYFLSPFGPIHVKIAGEVQVSVFL